MDYQYWVFLHVAGVLGFVMSHGVSVAVAFRVRKERDPARMLSLLQLSSASITWLYISILVLLGAGVAAGFIGDWWGQGWIWTSLVAFILTMGAMYALATNYYRRLRTIAEAMASGSQAIAEERLAEVVSGPRAWIIAALGFGSLLFILYLMLFKPF